MSAISTPIRLTEAARPAVLEHLLALSREDRYARFSSALSDAGIAAYANRIAIDHDLCFGICLPVGPLVGFIHLAIHGTVAELGASVLKSWRQQGHARHLFATALNAVATSGVREVHLASGHPAARHICASLGHRLLEGTTYPRIRVRLPKMAHALESILPCQPIFKKYAGQALCREIDL